MKPETEVNATICLGWRSKDLYWNASHQRKSNEYFFSLELNGQNKIKHHYKMPYTQGESKWERMSHLYEEMIEDVTTTFAQELKGIKDYKVMNRKSWDFPDRQSKSNAHYRNYQGPIMSDDAKKDFLDNLEAKLNGQEGINKELLTYDYENYRDTSMDSGPG